MDVTGHRKARSVHGLVVLLNPMIVAREGADVTREGCMSVPDFTANVRRATKLVVEGTTPDGAVRVIETDAFEARALQHEIDHLDGFLFLDRVASISADVFPRTRYAPPGPR
jgi:peptide deformylase